MAKSKKNKSGKKGASQTYSARRSANKTLTGALQANMENTKAFQQHDVKNRLGSFEGTGNHARTGNRGHQ